PQLATTAISLFSLHDALPISANRNVGGVPTPVARHRDTLVMRRSPAGQARHSPGRLLAQDPEGLQFGLQFTAGRRGPGRTDRGRWSSLNRSGRSRSELSCAALAVAVWP